MKLMLKLLFPVFLVMISFCGFGQSVRIVKKRNPKIDVSAYKQIAIGDIVGVSGLKDETSLDLTDALTSVLFNAKGLEVFDQNALRQILSSQRGSDIKIINEAATQLLSKNLGAAILIVGRQQTITYKVDNRNPSNPVCTFTVPVQIKAYEVKTSRMIYSDAVTLTYTNKSLLECEQTSQQGEKQLLKQTARSMAEEISHLFVPYNEEHVIDFALPMFATFKNPFKKINNVIVLFNSGKYDQGLEILKSYADDPSFKGNQRAMTYFNYGLGLYFCGKIAEAKSQFQLAMNFATDVSRSKYMYELMEKEIELSKN